MLDGDRFKPARPDYLNLLVLILKLHNDLLGAGHVACIVWDRHAALPDDRLACPFNDFRIDHLQQAMAALLFAQLAFGDINHERAPGITNLRRRYADGMTGINHGVNQVFQQL